MTAGRSAARDDGSAGLWLIAMVAVLWLALTAVLAFAGASAARHRAAGAAALAALAGAERLGSGDPQPCLASARIAQANGVRLDRCEVHRDVVSVRVSVEPRGVAGRLAALTGSRAAARARARPG